MPENLGLCVRPNLHSLSCRTFFQACPGMSGLRYCVSSTGTPVEAFRKKEMSPAVILSYVISYFMHIITLKLSLSRSKRPRIVYFYTTSISIS